MPTNPGPAAAVLAPPSGLNEIIATFGDILAFITLDDTLDPRWQGEFLDCDGTAICPSALVGYFPLGEAVHLSQAAGSNLYARI